VESRPHPGWPWTSSGLSRHIHQLKRSPSSEPGLQLLGPQAARGDWGVERFHRRGFPGVRGQKRGWGLVPTESGRIA